MRETATPTLGDQLAAAVAAIPEPIASHVESAVDALASACVAGSVKPLGVGDRAPDFELPDAFGGTVRLYERLTTGPVVLTFYRGDWCPFCNVQLRALQAAEPAFRERRASLLAINPQVADRSHALVEKERFAFDVLSDVDQHVIRAYGLQCEVTGAARALYDDVFGFDLSEQNGDGSWTVPIPATYVIDPSGAIVAAHVDADYRTRMEPEAILDALDDVTGNSAKGRE